MTLSGTKAYMDEIVPATPAAEPTPPEISHNYLPAQFADMNTIWNKIRKVVERGDFTLGRELTGLEDQWAKYVGTQHAIGVNSGTDALILILKASDIRGEVIVPAFTFYATAAAVEMAGAKPVFCDVGNDFNIDPSAIEATITQRTEAIIPVHWAGRPCNMEAIATIADSNNLLVVEDACHAIGASQNGIKCGKLGHAAAFSLHPLKTVNVWGDGGVITTDDDYLEVNLRKWRNHGLAGRDTCEFFAHNSRLDTIQAVVASHVLDKLPDFVSVRRGNAHILDVMLRDIPQITQVPVDLHSFMTYYLYSVHAENRDELLKYLNSNGIDAKAHYPKPLYLQPACAHLGHEYGEFPMADKCASDTISLPVHEFVTQRDCGRMSDAIRKFYGG